MTARFLVVVLTFFSACLMGGCTSLAPQVMGSANDYSNVMEEFTNQVLVTNVLRARDQAPLNFSDLPIIHGSIAQQTTGGLTLPFGPLNASTTRNTLLPTVQFTTSPTFDTSSLNTEAFTLNLLQPVSPVYIESLWSAGLPKQLLLHLFADSITLPSENGDAPTYFNRPGTSDYSKFDEVVDSLIAHDAQLRSFTVLDPVGLPLVVPKVGSGSVDALDSNSLKLYTSLIGLDPAHFKVGYVAGKDTAGFQIYRRFGSQIAMCVSSSATAAASRIAAGMSAGAVPAPSFPELSDEVDGSLQALGKILGKASPATVLLGSGEARRSSASAGGGGSANQPNSGAAPTKASSAQSGTNAAMTQAVQAYRVSGILNSAQCGDEEYVADRVGEKDYVQSTRKFGSIRWRSTLDIYYYLGALARDPSYSPRWTDGGRVHSLFSVAPGERGKSAGITVGYHGEVYSVLGNYPASANGEISHGLEVVSLIAQLVNIAKISSDIPKTRSFEILP